MKKSYRSKKNYILATPTFSQVNEKFVFISFVFKNFNIWNKKQQIILTVASKHFGHVMCYVADVESGSIRSKGGKNSAVRTEPTTG